MERGLYSIKSHFFFSKGHEECLREDAFRDFNPSDKESVSRNFPDWIRVRSSYQKRRQKTHIDFDDVYALPKEFTVTKFGAIRIGLGKEVEQKHRYPIFYILTPIQIFCYFIL